VCRYQKGKTNLDFTEARDSEWQWHQLGHMQVCNSLQTDNHASTPPLSFYRLDALPAPNQQRQSTEGITTANKETCNNKAYKLYTYGCCSLQAGHSAPLIHLIHVTNGTL